MNHIVKNRANILIFLIFSLIALSGVLYHEIWRDEAQVWLIVRDLDAAGVINHVRNEGHPLLWYFITMPFAKIGLPVLSMQILSYIFMTFSAGIFLWKSPFNIVSKICVIFSAGFLYWLTVISRNYSLIPLFLFLLAIFYKRQRSHPYIYALLNIFLLNTHILMFGFCSAIALLFGYENILKNIKNKKEYIAPFLIMVFCIISVALYILTRPETNISVDMNVTGGMNWNSVLIAVSDLFVNLYAQTGLISWIAGICISVCIIFIFLQNKKIFLVLLTSILYQFYVYICVYKTSPEKAFTFILILLFCFWIIMSENKISKSYAVFLNCAVVLIFGLSLNLSFYLMKNDFLYNYSSSKETAAFITNHIENEAIIISNNPLTTAGVLAYLPGRKFYLPFYNGFYTYGYSQKIDLTKPFEFKKPEEFKYKKVYYIYSALGKPDTKKSVVFESKNSLIPTEYFYIIKDE